MSDTGSDDDSSDYEDPDLLDGHAFPTSNKKYDFEDDENDETDDDVEEPLFKRLENLQKKSDERAFVSSTSSAAKKRKIQRDDSKATKNVTTKMAKDETELKRNKHMPAKMRSDKPVSR